MFPSAACRAVFTMSRVAVAARLPTLATRLNILSTGRVLALPHQRFFRSSPASAADELSVTGMDVHKPKITVPLPNGAVAFGLNPYGTVGGFSGDIQFEDKDVTSVTVFTEDGEQLSQRTRMSTVLAAPFQLRINDAVYTITPPPSESAADAASDTSALLQRLETMANDHEERKQNQEAVRAQLKALEAEFAPMEKLREECLAKGKASSTRLTWGFLAFLGVQWGFLARLTWWEYSWDLMEPVTYFITTGTNVCFLAYFLVTRHVYEYDVAADRRTWKTFYSAANSANLDVSRYNAVVAEIAAKKKDLQSLQ